MRIIERQAVSWGVALSLILLWPAQCGSSRVDAAQPQRSVTLTRLYTGTDGLTHTEQIPLKLSPVAGAPASVEESEHVKATNAYLVRLAPGFVEGWHNADERRYVVAIRGQAEIEVSGGGKVLVAPGSISLAEDLTGKGHTFRVVGKEDWVALFVDFAR